MSSRRLRLKTATKQMISRSKGIVREGQGIGPDLASVILCDQIHLLLLSHLDIVMLCIMPPPQRWIAQCDLAVRTGGAGIGSGWPTANESRESPRPCLTAKGGSRGGFGWWPNIRSVRKGAQRDEQVGPQSRSTYACTQSLALKTMADNNLVDQGLPPLFRMFNEIVSDLSPITV